MKEVELGQGDGTAPRRETGETSRAQEDSKEVTSLYRDPSCGAEEIRARLIENEREMTSVREELPGSVTWRFNQKLLEGGGQGRRYSEAKS